MGSENVTELLQCPRCLNTSGIFWLGYETSRCSDCGFVDNDSVFIYEEIEEGKCHEI